MLSNDNCHYQNYSWQGWVYPKRSAPTPFQLQAHEKSLSSTPKHLWDVQLSASGESAATNTEQKETSHRNLNTFTSFSEWINLKEQKECSKKGPSGNNFFREKKHHRSSTGLLSQSSSCTLLLQFSTLLSPSSTFLQRSTIDKMSSASSPNTRKPPCRISYSNHNIHSQAGTPPLCNHFNHTSLLHTYQLTKQVP